MDNTVSENTEKKTIEVKQSFFSSAISDISAYIQLVDTKVSISTTALVVSIAGVFVFGILTIRSHSSKIGYNSKWFLPQSTKEYSFDAYKEDILSMSDEDIIVNMAAELYKLNDINRQKNTTYRWALRSFAATLITIGVIYMLFLFSVV